MNLKERKVAVVLSGGGAKGAYEAGALSSIVRKTQEIHVMTGASIGAINAAVFAWEYEKTGDMLHAAKTVKDTWAELGSLFTISGWRIAGQMVRSVVNTRSPFRFPSLVDNTRIRRRLKELIPEHVKISDINRIELAINATCLTTGRTISFTRNNDAYLYEAVLASSSIPLVFDARLIEGGYYVDGGVFNNTPLRDAIEAQATDVFVVELKPKTKDLYLEEIQTPVKFDNVYEVGSRLLELIADKIMYEDLKNARKVNEIIDVIVALEATGGDRRVIENLKKSIGYEKLKAPLIRNGSFKGIFMEISYTSDRPDNLLFGHLTPYWMMTEMRNLAELVDPVNPQNALKGLRVVVTHNKPTLTDTISVRHSITKELEQQNDLGIDFIIPFQGHRIDF